MPAPAVVDDGTGGLSPVMLVVSAVLELLELPNDKLLVEEEELSGEMVSSAEVIERSTEDVVETMLPEDPVKTTLDVAELDIDTVSSPNVEEERLAGGNVPVDGTAEVALGYTDDP